MSSKPVERFEVDYVQILDEEGQLVPGASVPKELGAETLVEKYKLMRFLRAFDNKALSLQRQGRMGTYSEYKGQEAVQIAIAMALEKKDWLFPTYRDSGAIIARGVAPEKVLLYWAGDERGQEYPDDVHVFPVAIPVASQIPHAVGGAWALHYKKEDSVALVTIGDGGTSKADFYEGLNIAGDFRLPLVCVIQNNQYAISLPREKQTKSKTLAQKGLGMGIPGIQVDGNDLLAMYSVLKEVVEKARRGDGPTLVEAITYRLGHHTTATGDEPYRSEEEIARWRRKDPIERLRKYLEHLGMWNHYLEDQMEKEIKQRIDTAVKKFESVPRPEPKDVFNYVYSRIPKKLEKEKESIAAEKETAESDESIEQRNDESPQERTER